MTDLTGLVEIAAEIAHHLDRIATALETRQLEAEQRASAERHAVESQYLLLRRRAEEAGAMFAAADRALLDTRHGDAHAYLAAREPEKLERIQRLEDAALAAERALEEFAAAHPELDLELDLGPELDAVPFEDARRSEA